MTVLLNDRAIPWLSVSVIVVFIVIRIVSDRRKGAGPLICPVDRLGDNREQVKLLFDYTKFHITVYSTLAALLITISSSSVVGRFALSRPWLLSAFGGNNTSRTGGWCCSGVDASLHCDCQFLEP